MNFSPRMKVVDSLASPRLHYSSSSSNVFCMVGVLWRVILEKLAFLFGLYVLSTKDIDLSISLDLVTLLFRIFLFYPSFGLSVRLNYELLLPFVLTGSMRNFGIDYFRCFIECRRIHVGNINLSSFLVLS